MSASPDILVLHAPGDVFFQELPEYGVIKIADGAGIFGDAAVESVVGVTFQGRRAVFELNEPIPGVED
jgi:hypothetical protein